MLKEGEGRGQVGRTVRPCDQPGRAGPLARVVGQPADAPPHRPVHAATLGPFAPLALAVAAKARPDVPRVAKTPLAVPLRTDAPPSRPTAGQEVWAPLAGVGTGVTKPATPADREPLLPRGLHARAAVPRAIGDATARGHRPPTGAVGKAATGTTRTAAGGVARGVGTASAGVVEEAAGRARAAFEARRTPLTGPQPVSPRQIAAFRSATRS